MLKIKVVHLEVGQEIKHNGSWMFITLTTSIAHQITIEQKSIIH
jgi:hypothetical protein